MNMIISVATPKGGTGKTITAVSLAAGLAHRGKKTLLVDLDWQAASSRVLIDDYEKKFTQRRNDKVYGINKNKTVYATLSEGRPLLVSPSNISNLDIVPSNSEFTDSISRLDTKQIEAFRRSAEVLKINLDAIKDQYENIIIDCPPSLGRATINALFASEGVVVPVSGISDVASGIDELIEKVYLVKILNPTGLKRLGFLFTMSALIFSKKLSQRLQKDYPNQIFNTEIPSSPEDVYYAMQLKRDIFTYKPESPVAKAYQELIDEIFTPPSENHFPTLPPPTKAMEAVVEMRFR